jgi:Neu-associated kinase
MRTVDVKIMSMAGDSEQDKTPSPTPSSNDCLPPSVVQVSREELRKFLKCKRVGNYLLGKTIGEGSFAKVKQGFHVLTGEKVCKPSLKIYITSS